PGLGGRPGLLVSAVGGDDTQDDERDDQHQRQQRDELDARLTARRASVREAARRRAGAAPGGAARRRDAAMPADAALGGGAGRGHAFWGRKWAVAATRPRLRAGRRRGMRTETRTSPAAVAWTCRPDSSPLGRWARAAAAASAPTAFARAAARAATCAS